MYHILFGSSTMALKRINIDSFDVEVLREDLENIIQFILGKGYEYGTVYDWDGNDGVDCQQ